MNAENKGKKARLLRYLIAIAWIKFVFGLNEGKYPESLPTLNEVPNCPRNKEDWQVAAEGKHCDQIKNIENTPFVYHCLINAWANATVEVCAPTWYISGYCAMYSVPDARVIDNEKYDCTKYTPPCPPRYLSSEAYKYSVCYDIARPTTTQTILLVNLTQERPTDSSTDTTISSSSEFTTIHLILVIVIPATFLIILSVGTFFLCKVIKKRRQAGNRTIGDEEVGIPLQTSISDAPEVQEGTEEAKHPKTQSNADGNRTVGDEAVEFPLQTPNSGEFDVCKEEEKSRDSKVYQSNYTVGDIKLKMDLK
ncbi:uncharacterized protein LOC134282707 isoform X2 [Saccostrea cucullata]|uniref:uncharacterized protein LOC134282707 isoform X2 n=1 Tax=Saccostrea cuccullata TaxID=36930 RepID=UPI002ED42BE1